MRLPALPMPSRHASDLAPASGLRWLLLIMLVGLLLRAGVVAWFGNRPPEIFDEHDYDQIAATLATTGRFAHGIDASPTSIRPPLFPAFVATLYAVFGVGNYLAVRIAQALLGVGTIVPLYVIARRMFSVRTALWTAGFVACYPELVGFSALLLTETLFAFLVVLVALAMQQLLIDVRPRSAVSLGVLLGLAALTRSVLMPFVPVIVVFLFWAFRQQSAWRRWATAAFMVASFAAVIAPWVIRNTLLEGTLTTIDSMGGRNLMMGNYEYTPLYRSWDTITIEAGDRSWHRVLAAEHPEFSKLTQGQRDKLAMRRGLQFMFGHPGLTLTRSVVKFFDFWQLERVIVAGMKKGLWGSFSRATIVASAAIICGSYAFALLAVIYGFVTRRPLDMRMHWFLLLLVGFTCAVHSIVFGHSRYHLALIPLVLIYAASAVSAPRSAERTHARISSWLGIGLALVLVVSWIVRLVCADLGKIAVPGGATRPAAIAQQDCGEAERGFATAALCKLTRVSPITTAAVVRKIP